ncbi:MAG TPA: serine hydrolase [Gemmatimonadaceae bacterium]|nr:serine hydrolase [Gemmatimonadaceae bacterium]
MSVFRCPRRLFGHALERRAFARISFVALSFYIAAPTLAAQGPLGDFDAYVAKAVNDWNVPGLAIAVVKDDSVVFAKGYGVRTIGSHDRVDTHTLFANASTTKAFTALAIEMLAADGKVRVDAPVITYLPWLQLSDPYVTREVTVRDLLTHRTGLPEADFLWYGTSTDLPEIVRRLRYVKPETSFRTHFTYENDTYAAAGLIVQQASGESWERFDKQRIFDPLGMHETYTNTAAAAAESNIATPHYEVDDTVRAVPRLATDNIGPAGAMYSSVSDMARWIRFLLDSGRVNGTPLLDSAHFNEMFRVQMPVGADGFYPTAQLTHPHFTAYGLGWFLEDYRGEYVVFHTGSIDGFVAIVGLIPDRKVGVVVFANLDHAEVRHALMYTVFDRYLGGGTHDWSTEMLAMYRGMEREQRAQDEAALATRVRGTSPSLALDQYAGTYTDSLYGSATVRLEHGALVLETNPLMAADLEPWNYDTFMARYRNRWEGHDLVTFRLGPNGKVAALDLGHGEVLARAP